MKRREFMLGTVSLAGAAAIGVEDSAIAWPSQRLRLNYLLLGDELHDALSLHDADREFGSLLNNSPIRWGAAVRSVSKDLLCVPVLQASPDWLLMSDVEVLRLSGGEVVKFVLFEWTKNRGFLSYASQFTCAETRQFGSAIYRDIVNFASRRATRWRWRRWTPSV